MSGLLVAVFEIQKLIAENKRPEARVLLEKTMRENPLVPALDFLGASLDVLDGKKEEAKLRLKKAVEVHPNYADGNSLYKSLTGEREKK